MNRKPGPGLRLLGLAAVVVAPAALGFHCGGGVPLTSPSGASLSISADPLTLPLENGVSTITVRGFKASSDGGGPLADGTQIYFSTPVGIIDERVEMKDGIARALLRSDGRSGRAAVVATSGSGVSVTLDPPVLIGNVAGTTILLTADPFTNAPDYTSQILATVLDSGGRPVPDVPLLFTTTAGSLGSAGSFVRTNALGQASDRLNLANDSVARVSASSGPVVSNTVTVVRAGVTGPVIRSVSPASGSAGQAVTMTISGLNFQGTPTVTFTPSLTSPGSTIMATLVDANTVRAQFTIDSGATLGARDVTVSFTPGGASNTLTGGFTVVARGAPTVSAVSPSSGVRGQTLSVTVSGSNFQTGATVTFGAGITVSVSAVTATSIQAQVTIAAAATPGARTVTVTNPDGQSGTLPNGFTVSSPAPTVSSIQPQSAVLGSQITATISGANFQTGAVVGIGTAADVTVTVISTASTTIQVSLTVSGTALPGPRDVTVTNPDGQTGTLTGGFTLTLF